MRSSIAPQAFVHSHTTFLSQPNTVQPTCSTNTLRLIHLGGIQVNSNSKTSALHTARIRTAAG